MSENDFAATAAKLTELRQRTDLEVATLAGGCFWCLQAPYETEPGVVAVLAGYTGGKRPNPTYDQIGTGVTGHREAVQVWFDPKTITYQKILDIYWLQIDPTDAGGQFADRGTQYQTAIFYHSPEQHELAENSKTKLDQSGMYEKPITVAVLPATEFYPAEDYHQSYYKKEPDHYYAYAEGSGRKAGVEKNKELRKRAGTVS